MTDTAPPTAAPAAPDRSDALRKALRQRGELLALGVLLLSVIVLVGSAPAGMYGMAVVYAAVIAFQAAGLVMVYRASRVINFAQLGIGAVSGVVFLAMVQRRAMLQGLHTVCRPCLRAPTGEAAAQTIGPTDALREVSSAEMAARAAPTWLVQLDYLLSAILAVGLAVALIWIIYILFIKRFTQAPKLVLTVTMIAAGEVVRVLGEKVLDFIFRPSSDNPVVRPDAVAVPVDVEFSLGRTVFRATDLVTVGLALVVAVALVAVLRRSAVGVVLRASSENPDRAATLGVNVSVVSSRAWLIAGALSGAASVLVAAKVGAGGFEDLVFLVRPLAAAVAGGFTSFPLVLAGALVVGLVDQLVLWNTNSNSTASLLLFVLILAVLLVQRARASRAEIEAHSTWEASREIRPTPSELRGLDVVRNTMRTLGVVAAVVALGYPWIMSPGQIEAGVVTIVYAMVALSLLVLTGWAGQISLGQMAFAAIGAYVAAYSGWPLPFALVLAGVVGAAAATVVGLPSLRLRGLSLAVSTLALGVATPELLLGTANLGRHLPRTLPRPLLLGIDFNDQRAFYYLSLGILALVVAAIAGLRRSDTARMLIAMKDNERAAQALGINLYRSRLLAFAAAGFVAAVAGGLLAFSQGMVNPASYTPENGVMVFLLAVIGGLGSIAGPILGALYRGLLEIAATTPFAPITDILLSPGLGVLVLLMTLPGGLAQGLFGMRDAWLRRVASRHRIEVPSLVADRAQGEGDVFDMAPKLRPTGAAERVPVRYRLKGQWMAERLVHDLRKSGKATRPRAVTRA